MPDHFLTHSTRPENLNFIIVESDYSTLNANFTWAIINNKDVIQLVSMEIVIDMLGSCWRDMSKLIGRRCSHWTFLG